MSHEIEVKVDDICQTDMFIIKYFHTPNKDYLLHIYSMQKKNQN